MNVDFQYMNSTRTWNPLSGNPTCWILGENLYCSVTHPLGIHANAQSMTWKSFIGFLWFS